MSSSVHPWRRRLMTRREASAVLFVGFTHSFLPSRAAVAAPPHSESPIAQRILLLHHAVPRESQVHVVLEVEGQLLVSPSGQEKESQTLPLKALGDLVYAERPDPNDPATMQRWYQRAHADLDVDGKSRRVELREDRRFISVDHPESRHRFQATEGSLTRDELELIDVPGGSQSLQQLLPGRELSIGETWNLEDDLVARLVNLDDVKTHDLRGRLDSADAAAAQLSVDGKVQGIVRGVATELVVKAKLRYDRQEQRLVWMALGIQEERAAGLAEPGLKVQARLRIAIEPSQTPQIADDAFPRVAPSDESQLVADLLEYHPRSERFSLIHGRDWYVLQERPDLSVLRWIDTNRLIAQCNLRPLGPVNAENRLTLTKFQQEIRTALGASIRQIVEATETTLPNQSQQLRVSVIGQVGDTPIHWLYYHLTAPSGQRMTCVFTMSGDQVERFGAEDQSLVQSVRWQDSTGAIPPTPVATQPARSLLERLE